MNNVKVKSGVFAFALMGMASQATAADVTASIAFTTLPEITINPIRDLAFGNVLSLTAGSLCAMSVSSGTDALAVTQTGLTAPTSTGALTGSCDTSTNGTVGIYEISSFPGAVINVTLDKGTATEIDFTPVGSAITYAAAAGAASALTAGTGVNITASSSGSTEVTAGAILTGRNRVIVGGTIQNTQALTADGVYTTDFEINVIYN